MTTAGKYMFSKVYKVYKEDLPHEEQLSEKRCFVGVSLPKGDFCLVIGQDCGPGQPLTFFYVLDIPTTSKHHM